MKKSGVLVFNSILGYKMKICCDGDIWICSEIRDIMFFCLDDF